MADLNKQVSSEYALIEEFKEKLLADLSALVRLAYTIREFCSKNPSPATPRPCDECPDPITRKADSKIGRGYAANEYSKDCIKVLNELKAQGNREKL